MKNSIQLLTVFIGLLLLASGCATITYDAAGNPAERINWREYSDC